LYQLIDITNEYLEFPHEVKLEINDDYFGIDLPSITFCLKRDDFWNKENFERSHNNRSFNCNCCDELCETNLPKINNKTTNGIIEDQNITRFYQLFDKTVNLSSILKCSFISSDEKQIISNEKCEHIAKIVEFLSKNSRFEKCLTFFNINQRNENFKVYELDKWSRIEYEVLVKHNFSDVLYLSIHSSHSIFKTTFFYPINIEENKVYNFKISKSFVTNLEWPHETNCLKDKLKYHSTKRRIYSFEDCINSCVLNKMLENNKCIQKDGIIGYNVELNEKTKNLKLCENITKNLTVIKAENLCSRKCNQNCINEFIDVYLQQKNENSNKTIAIQSANTPIHKYELHPKLLFIDYASNMGSIMTVWFSVAVVDVHKAVKQTIVCIFHVFKIFNSILNVEKYFAYLSTVLRLLVFANNFLMQVLLKMKKINWKLLSRQVVVKSKEYEINGSLVSSPGISFCKEKIFLNEEKSISLKSFKGGVDLEIFFKNCKFNKTLEVDCVRNYTEFSQILKEQKLMSDYLNVFDLKLDRKRCCFNEGRYCDPKCNTFGVMSHNKALKCYTIFSKLNTNFNINNLTKISNINKARFRFISNINKARFRFWGKNILFIHDSYELPTFFNSKLFATVIQGKFPFYYYGKTTIERLPTPYETNCEYYSGSIRSQSECFNELLFEEYLKNDCLPKSDRNITYVINNNDYSKFKHKICGNFTLEMSNNFLNQRNQRCRKSCTEELYEIWESEKVFEKGWYK
jgi:hypothetical protein